MSYEYNDTIDHPQPGHTRQKADKLEGVSVELEAHRFWVENGSHQVPLRCVKPWTANIVNIAGRNSSSLPQQLHVYCENHLFKLQLYISWLSFFA